MLVSEQATVAITRLLRAQILPSFNIMMNALFNKYLELLKVNMGELKHNDATPHVRLIILL